MSRQIPIITRVEFFDTSYEPSRARVAARNFSSLTYRKSGKVSVSSGEDIIVSCADTLTLVPRECDYYTEIIEGGEMTVLHYYTLDEGEDLVDKPMLIIPTHKEAFLNLFSRALRHSRSGNECACMADAYRLFSEIENELSSKGARPSPLMMSVKQYADENITDPELRISYLAQLHKSSEAYFRREFKKYYRESPIEYIKRRRIELACNLLHTELYSVAEVATRSGFDSVSYFSSEFKRALGCSPTEYRNT